MKLRLYSQKMMLLALLGLAVGCSEAPQSMSNKTVKNNTQQDESKTFTGIRGKLLDFAGQPLVHGQIQLKDLGDITRPNSQYIDVADDGRYQLDLTVGKQYGVTFIGLAHEQIKYVIDFDQAQDLLMNVNLDYLPMKAKPQNLSLFILDMAPEGTKKPRNEAMTVVSDNRYTVSLDMPAGNFRYKIDGVSKGGHSIGNPMTGPYGTSQYGDFYTVVEHPGGAFEVNYQHQVMADPLAAKPLQLEGEWGTQRKALELQQQFGRILSDQRIARRTERSGDFSYDIGIEQLAKWRQQYASSAYAEMVLAMSTAMRGQQFELNRQAFTTFDGKTPWLHLPEVSLSQMFKQASMLGVDKEDEQQQLLAYTQFYLDNKDKAAHYFRHFADDDSKSRLIATLAYQFRAQNDKQNYQDLYTMLQERYSHVGDYQFYMKMLAPPTVPVGEPAPDFNIAAMMEQGVHYTNDQFKGKVLLIDFWATWCTPCLKEMPDLHRVYQKFQPQGFEILSLSADINQSDVTDFVKGKWKMPWKHAFLDGGEHPMVSDYGVFGYPMAFLVDEQGVVITLGDDARAHQLEQTLSKYFAAK